MEKIKQNWSLILIALATIALGALATISVVTAIRLNQAINRTTTPITPKTAPAQEITLTPTPPCELSFCIPTLTPTPTTTLTITPTPTISITPTPQPLICSTIRREPTGTIPKKGDAITIICASQADQTAPINHFEFRATINSGTPTPLSNSAATIVGNQYQGQINYLIPDYGCYLIECRACASVNSTQCTAWGQAK